MTGFRKRKNERRKKAQDDLKLQLKEDGKRIRQEVKDRYKTMTKSYQPIPELDELLEEKEDEYDTGNVSVKVVELNTADLGKLKKIEIDNLEPEKNINISEIEEVPGMEMTTKKILPKSENQINEKVTKESEILPRTKKELNKILKNQATSSLKKTKAFQIKRKMDKIKDKKKFRRDQKRPRKTNDSKHGKKSKSKKH